MLYFCLCWGLSFSNLFMMPGILSFGIIKNMIFSIPVLFTRPEELSGIIGVVTQSKEILDLGINNFFLLTGLISLNLTFLNLLPLPPLDGGKILFSCLEKINLKFKGAEYRFSFIGGVLILCLLFYSLVIDLNKIVFS